jgi:probable F420-dependent oxidoreductase
MTTFGYVIPSFGPFADPGAMAHLLQAGEDLGYADVWFGDHVVVPRYAAALTQPDWLEPLTACFLGLGRTTRLRFGTDVLVAPYRNPVLVAKMVATADHLSGGRLTLGVGVGYLRGEFAALGADYARRGDVTDEFLAVLRTLWSATGPIDYEGTDVTLHDVVFGPPPVQRPIPLWVGGNAPRALRRAADLGDGWHPLFPTPEQYAAARATILARRGADAAPFTFSYSCAVTTLLDRPPADFATGTWDELGDIPDDFSYAPPLPADPSGRPRFLGTVDQVADDIADYQRAGVEHFTLRFANGSPDVGVDDMTRSMERFVREVLPRVATSTHTDHSERT